MIRPVITVLLKLIALYLFLLIRARKEANAHTAKEMEQLEVKGTTKEIFQNIQINLKIEPTSLEFSVPPDAVLEK